MRKKVLVNMGLVCVLAVAGWIADSEVHATPNTSTGEGSAFASTADGMVSTIESFIEVKDFDAAEKAALELTQHNSE